MDALIVAAVFVVWFGLAFVLAFIFGGIARQRDRH